MESGAGEKVESQTWSINELIDTYGKKVFNLAVRITGNRQDAEDVVQETFLHVLNGVSRFRNESHPCTWIYRIAVNAALRVKKDLNSAYLDSLDEKIEAFGEEIPAEAELFASAAFIPSGGNRHSHRFTVLSRDRTRAELMTEIKRVYRLRSALMNNPVLQRLVRPFVDRQARGFLKDREYGRRMREIISRLDAGEDPLFYNAPLVVIIHSREPIPTPKRRFGAGWICAVPRWTIPWAGNLLCHPRPECH